MTAAELDEILWRHLRETPYFRAALHAVEDSFYQGIRLDPPVLDLGCGDGRFAALAFDPAPRVGLDPSPLALKEAREREAYRLVVRGQGEELPFPAGWFGSVACNSVLEHIPDVAQVLDGVARVLRPGGTFAFCVPNQRFPRLLLGRQALERLGWRSGGAAYARWFNRISRHVHCDPPETWRARLAQSGFEVVTAWDYFPPRALHTLEMGHYFGLPSLLARKLTGHWVLVPSRANLRLAWRLTRPILDAPIAPDGAYSFFVARRTAGS